jgi:hypothetical protein
MSPRVDTRVRPTTDSPPVANDRTLAVIVAACSSLSVGAFLAHVYLDVPMPFTLSAFSFPALVATIGITVWAKRAARMRFLRRMWVGCVAGAFAIVGYDLLRWLILFVTPSDFDPFRAHRPFGALILSTSPHTTAALVAGWGYHLWNGFSFAVMYALLAGGARWWWGLLWAMTLESATILVYPGAFGISLSNWAFVATSLAGHAVYGFVLGVLARQWLREPPWPTTLALERPTLRAGLS